MRHALATGYVVAMMAGLAGAPASQEPAVRALDRAWRYPVTGQIEHLSIAADGTCVGAIEQTRSALGGLTDRRRVLTLTPSGQLRWQLQLSAGLSRTTSLAVAPGCRWAAIGQLPTDSYDIAVTRDLLIADADGIRATAPIKGVVRSAAISRQGDLLAVGVEAAPDAPNVFVIAPTGKVVFALEAQSYGAPLVQFSDAGERVMVAAWFGVGMIRRSGTIAWGVTRDAGWSRWRRIEASRDAEWFAAHEAPMHGPQGGSAALLRADGSTVWETPGLWDPGAVIAPDASYLVVAGAPMSEYAGPDPPLAPRARLAVRSRDGRTLAERDMPSTSLAFVSGDSESIVVIDRTPTAREGPDLVVLDRALRTTSRTPIGAEAWGPVWYRDSGLVVLRSREGIDAFVIPQRRPVGSAPTQNPVPAPHGPRNPGTFPPASLCRAWYNESVPAR